MPFTPAPWPRRLRSQEWFGGDSRDNIYHRSWMKNQGYPADLFDGRPVIGICNTWSELTPCNAHLLAHAPDAGARAQLLPAPLAVEHRPAGHADGRQVDAGRAHQQRRRGLVAANQQ